MRVARLCLVENGREKCEAEPLDMRYQAEPGNEGFSPAQIFSSVFLLPSSFFLLPSTRHFLPASDSTAYQLPPQIPSVTD
jgi:hypothetical protein